METNFFFFQQKYEKCIKLFILTLVSDCSGYVFSGPIFRHFTSDMRQSKTFILSTNVDLRSLETEFLIAVCSPTVNYS